MALKIIEREVIADNAINAAKVEDGTIVAADLATGFITNAHVKSDAAIAASKITGLATSATTDTTSATNITSGSLATARVNVGTTAGKILQVDGSGNLPAIDGSQLTGVESFTKSASDPTISTNPSGGVGTEWVNTTNGEIYLCTDATADENVWTNVGAGTGDVAPTPTSQGTQYGFLGGGYGSAAIGLNIQKFSLTSDANATDHGADLSTSKSYAGGHQNFFYGYTAGGQHPSTGVQINVIDKFPFASSTTASDVGDIAAGANDQFAAASSTTYGYIAGGVGSPVYDGTNQIAKFSFTSDGNSSDVGNLINQRYRSSGNSHIDGGYGYHSAGSRYSGSWAWDNTIQKYAFASDGNAVDVADLTIGRENPAGCDSTTYGYQAGGQNPPAVDRIEKHQFTTTNNSTDVGNLLGTLSYGAGVSSTTYGYFCGGYWGSPSNVIQKYSYSSDGNSTDVGDILSAMYECAGIHQ